MSAVAGRWRQTVCRAGHVRLTLGSSDSGHRVDAIEVEGANGWTTVLRAAGPEFSTTFGASDGFALQVDGSDGGPWEITLRGECAAWSAEETIALDADGTIRRTQTFGIAGEQHGAIAPAWELVATPTTRYTYPLRAFSAQPGELGERICSDVAWALPLPAHLLYDEHWVGCYGVDRTVSPGTLFFQPAGPGHGRARIGVQLPDGGDQPQSADPELTGDVREAITHVHDVGETTFAAGAQATIVELIRLAPHDGAQDPLLAAVKLAAGALLSEPRTPDDAAGVSDGVADFYRRCKLWNPDALGPGAGWYTNMWVRVTGAAPSFTSDGAGRFDLGWGEGTACDTIPALAARWQRTGERDLLPHLDEMARSFERFRRTPDGPASGYYDRLGPEGYVDFMGRDLLWSHSNGYLGVQLLQAALDHPDYPDAQAREQWIATALTIARWLRAHQRADGDLPDLFGADEQPIDVVTGRVAARAVVCGLWTLAHELAADEGFLDAARALAAAVAPQVLASDFQNQMVDAHGAAAPIPDGEGVNYVLQGLVTLYRATHDPELLRLCERTAAVSACWTYFFDVPHGYRGVTRGGQCCRMPDYPLVFPGGTAKAVRPLLDLHEETGDPYYRLIAGETVAMLAAYQVYAPNTPWDGGIVHAIDQHSGRLWGPDREGQVDSGMSTAGALIGLEEWLRRDGAAA